MMNKKFSLMMVMILCALFAKAQDIPPDSNWESDPLDVLESESVEPQESAAPEFKEILESGEDVVETPDIPPPSLETEEPADLDVALPEEKTQQEVAPLLGNSDPDFVREAEFHRIYKNYNEQPTSEEVWGKAVEGRSAEVYKVQQGDTLWGISTTFFGDPNFWPKIWSLNNGEILNPHEINPQMSVQFFPGTSEEAPALNLTSETPLTDAVPKEPLVLEQGEAEKAKPAAGQVVVEIPPPKKRAPLLKKLPASLPQHRPIPTAEAALEFQVMPKMGQFPKALEYLQYYVADEPVVGVGVVTETELGMQTAGENQIVYVRLDSEATGKTFVVEKNLNEITDQYEQKRKAQKIEIQGEIEIAEKVNEQENIYRAIVKKDLQPIDVGAKLVPGRLVLMDPAATPVTQGVGGRIIGGQFEGKRTLFGNNTLVFLDAGLNQGLQVGQTLTIFADQRVRKKGTSILINDRTIGQVKIVRLSHNFATAYVVKATDEIVVGDYAGKIVTQAANQVVEVPEDSAAPVADEFSDFDDTSVDSTESAPDDGLDESELDL